MDKQQRQHREYNIKNGFSARFCIIEKADLKENLNIWGNKENWISSSKYLILGLDQSIPIFSHWYIILFQMMPSAQPCRAQLRGNNVPDLSVLQAFPSKKSDFIPVTLILVKMEVLAALITDTGMAAGEVHQNPIK